MRLYLFILMLMSVGGYAQSGIEIYPDAQSGSKVFRGELTFGDLKGEKSFDWFQKNADAYVPDSATLKLLSKNISNYKLVIVMGTWCSDSHDMIPRLYKVLELCKFPMGNYAMYGTNRAKETLNAESKLYRIVNVPTVIVSKGNIEIGRMVETPKKSVEADLQAIIEKDMAEKK